MFGSAGAGVSVFSDNKNIITAQAAGGEFPSDGSITSVGKKTSIKYVAGGDPNKFMPKGTQYSGSYSGNKKDIQPYPNWDGLTFYMTNHKGAGGFNTDGNVMNRWNTSVLAKDQTAWTWSGKPSTLKSHKPYVIYPTKGKLADGKYLAVKLQINPSAGWTVYNKGTNTVSFSQDSIGFWQGGWTKLGLNYIIGSYNGKSAKTFKPATSKEAKGMFLTFQDIDMSQFIQFTKAQSKKVAQISGFPSSNLKFNYDNKSGATLIMAPDNYQAKNGTKDGNYKNWFTVVANSKAISSSGLQFAVGRDYLAAYGHDSTVPGRSRIKGKVIGDKWTDGKYIDFSRSKDTKQNKKNLNGNELYNFADYLPNPIQPAAPYKLVANKHKDGSNGFLASTNLAKGTGNKSGDMGTTNKVAKEKDTYHYAIDFNIPQRMEDADGPRNFKAITFTDKMSKNLKVTDVRIYDAGQNTNPAKWTPISSWNSTDGSKKGDRWNAPTVTGTPANGQTVKITANMDHKTLYGTDFVVKINVHADKGSKGFSGVTYAYKKVNGDGIATGDITSKSNYSTGVIDQAHVNINEYGSKSNFTLYTNPVKTTYKSTPPPPPKGKVVKSVSAPHKSGDTNQSNGALYAIQDKSSNGDDPSRNIVDGENKSKWPGEPDGDVATYTVKLGPADWDAYYYTEEPNGDGGTTSVAHTNYETHTLTDTLTEDDFGADSQGAESDKYTYVAGSAKVLSGNGTIEGANIPSNAHHFNLSIKQQGQSTVTIQYKAKLNPNKPQSDFDSTQMTNWASWNGATDHTTIPIVVPHLTKVVEDYYDGNGYNDTGLQADKKGPAAAEQGNSVHYKVSVSNSGTGAWLPADMEFKDTLTSGSDEMKYIPNTTTVNGDSVSDSTMNWSPSGAATSFDYKYPHSLGAGDSFDFEYDMFLFNNGTKVINKVDNPGTSTSPGTPSETTTLVPIIPAPTLQSMKLIYVKRFNHNTGKYDSDWQYYNTDDDKQRKNYLEPGDKVKYVVDSENINPWSEALNVKTVDNVPWNVSVISGTEKSYVLEGSYEYNKSATTGWDSAYEGNLGASTDSTDKIHNWNVKKVSTGSASSSGSAGAQTVTGTNSPVWGQIPATGPGGFANGDTELNMNNTDGIWRPYAASGHSILEFQGIVNRRDPKLLTDNVYNVADVSYDNPPIPPEVPQVPTPPTPNVNQPHTKNPVTPDPKIKKIGATKYGTNGSSDTDKVLDNKILQNNDTNPDTKIYDNTKPANELLFAASSSSRVHEPTGDYGKKLDSILNDKEDGEGKLYPSDLITYTIDAWNKDGAVMWDPSIRDSFSSDLASYIPGTTKYGTDLDHMRSLTDGQAGWTNSNGTYSMNMDNNSDYNTNYTGNLYKVTAKLQDKVNDDKESVDAAQNKVDIAQAAKNSDADALKTAIDTAQTNLDNAKQQLEDDKTQQKDIDDAVTTTQKSLDDFNAGAKAATDDQTAGKDKADLTDKSDDYKNGYELTFGKTSDEDVAAATKALKKLTTAANDAKDNQNNFTGTIDADNDDITDYQKTLDDAKATAEMTPEELDKKLTEAQNVLKAAKKQKTTDQKALDDANTPLLGGIKLLPDLYSINEPKTDANYADHIHHIYVQYTVRLKDASKGDLINEAEIHTPPYEPYDHMPPAAPAITKTPVVNPGISKKGYVPGKPHTTANETKKVKVGNNVEYVVTLTNKGATADWDNTTLADGTKILKKVG